MRCDVMASATVFETSTDKDIRGKKKYINSSTNRKTKGKRYAWRGKASNISVPLLSSIVIIGRFHHRIITPLVTVGITKFCTTLRSPC